MDSSRLRPGVRGWLLVLCVMLTVVGPLISVGLMFDQIRTAAPYLNDSLVLQGATLVSVMLWSAAIAVAIRAGADLWSVRPNAVASAKRAMLIGLAADVFTSLIRLLTEPGAGAGSLLWRLELDLIPALVFFTVCFAYLNRSERVHLTWCSPSTNTAAMRCE